MPSTHASLTSCSIVLYLSNVMIEAQPPHAALHNISPSPWFSPLCLIRQPHAQPYLSEPLSCVPLCIVCMPLYVCSFQLTIQATYSSRPIGLGFFAFSGGPQSTSLLCNDQEPGGLWGPCPEKVWKESKKCYRELSVSVCIGQWCDKMVLERDSLVYQRAEKGRGAS